MSGNQSNAKRFFEPRIELWIASIVRFEFLKCFLCNQEEVNRNTCQELGTQWHTCITKGAVLPLLHRLGIKIPRELRILIHQLSSILQIMSKLIVNHEHVPIFELIEENIGSVQNKWDAWLKLLGRNVDRAALTALELELQHLRFGTSSDEQRAKYSFFIELLPNRKPYRGTYPEISIREAMLDQVEQQPPHESLAPADTNVSHPQSTREHLLELWMTITDIIMHKANAIGRINLHCKEMCDYLSRNVSDLFESGTLVNPRIQPLTFHDINKWLTDGHYKMNRIADYYIGMVTKAADDTIAVLRDVERLLNENPSSHIMRVGTVNCFDRKVQHMHRDMEKAMDRARREAAASRIL